MSFLDVGKIHEKKNLSHIKLYTYIKHCILGLFMQMGFKYSMQLMRSMTYTNDTQIVMNSFVDSIRRFVHIYKFHFFLNCTNDKGKYKNIIEVQ